MTRSQKARAKFMNLFASPLYRRGLFTGVFVTGLTFLYGSALDKYLKKKRAEAKSDTLAVEGTNDKSLEDVRILNRGRQILKYGVPDRGSDIRYYRNHVLVYDQQKRTPVWVAEHLTADNLKGSAHRKNVKFKPDPGVEEIFTAQNSDYLGSGWSRGHLCPAGNNKASQDAMAESFYLSNIVPQNLENNAGFWNRLEIYCRDLTQKYPSVRVISGPLILPEVEEDGKKFVKYQVIGTNEVAVPTHLFKLIILENRKAIPKAIGAFIVPNMPLGFQYKLTDFQVDVQDLEKVAGVRFTPNLDVKSLKNLCKVDKCKLMERDAFELYFIGRKLESASTMARLETVWAELKEKNIKPDKYAKDLYTRKKKELSDCKT